eukprot:EC816759.1.p6 GENE.EC816759.1~~EC816759.1.p6  ORF type:complete len:67 (-),score=14.75 EC816759.1:174-374(-)
MRARALVHLGARNEKVLGRRSLHVERERHGALLATAQRVERDVSTANHALDKLGRRRSAPLRNCRA